MSISSALFHIGCAVWLLEICWFFDIYLNHLLALKKGKVDLELKDFEPE